MDGGHAPWRDWRLGLVKSQNRRLVHVWSIRTAGPKCGAREVRPWMVRGLSEVDPFIRQHRPSKYRRCWSCMDLIRVERLLMGATGPIGRWMALA